MTDKGLEGTAILELKELIKAVGRVLESSIVSFSFKSYKDLALLCYKAQSVQRVICLLGKAACKPDLAKIGEATKKLCEEIDWKFSNEKSFRCEAEHLLETDFASVDLEREIGGHIHDQLDKLKLSPKVKLKDTDIIIYALLGKSLYPGIDFSGRDLSKRTYKIYHHSSALRGTIAYALVRFSAYKSGQEIVDPFAGSGIIAIETALFSANFPVNYFTKNFAFQKLPLKEDWEAVFKVANDKIKESELPIFSFDHLLMNMKASQNNAKIAGIDKCIKFSKTDVEWLDTQFEKDSVDHIITHPPEPSQHLDKKTIAKLYKEFFYQSAFVLKPEGKITVLLRNKDLFLEVAKERFSLVKEQEVWMGKQRLVMLQLKKSKNL